MKKIIALILIITSLFMLVGCGKETMNTAGVEVKANINEHAQVPIENVFITRVGKYYAFQTSETDEYLMFLSQFDEEQYEIVDISCRRYDYVVTYKEIDTE